MPCAAGELCLIPDQSLRPNQGHGCRGGCGGRLHGLCGEQEEEDGSELYRICPTCASKQFAGAASKAAAGRRKARENATSGSKRKKRWSRKKGGQNCAAYAALRREDGPTRGGGQGDFSRNCGWAVQVRGADSPEHQSKQEGHPKAGRHSTGQPQVESPGGIQTPT